jgi:hypothetical protein
MKTRFGVALVLVVFGIAGGQAWGQLFRIPIPRAVPFRWPVHFPVHVPLHPPTSFPQSTDPSHRNQTSGNSAASGPASVIALVSLCIGLSATLVLVLGVVLATFAELKKPQPSSGLIRIISTPPGEADRSIREAWVGLELPLAKTKDQGQELAAMGVLSWKQDRTIGYVVEGRVALERLAAYSPEAAIWWRENVPHVLDSGYQFIFPGDNCQKLA